MQALRTGEGVRNGAILTVRVMVMSGPAMLHFDFHLRLTNADANSDPGRAALLQEGVAS